MEDQSAQTKHMASVRDTARMVGLSPARFYQLQRAGIFPMPVYDIITRRPRYTTEQQEQCLEVRRRNCGINGKPVMFYAKRIDVAAPQHRSSRRAAKKTKAVHIDILEAVRALGLSSATAAAVDAAVQKLFQGGIAGLAEGEVIKQVFVYLKRQNRGDSVG